MPMAARQAARKENQPVREYLICLNAKAAEAVLNEWGGAGGRSNSVSLSRTSREVVDINYADKRYPLDVASWAFENGYASDNASAQVIAGL
jgi:molybdopterin-guanine dinucleotide biosynthesis protein A